MKAAAWRHDLQRGGFMTDQDREFNGRMIEELCKLGEGVIKPYEEKLCKSAAEQCGMTETQYRHAEALHLYGDLSGIER